MNTSVPMPTVAPECGGPNCKLPMCQGHGPKKVPWWDLIKPVRDELIEDPTVYLMKENGWTLEKWTERDTDSSLYHYCPATQWKKMIMYNEIKQGWCSECLEDVPESFVAAYTMHNWQLIQQIEADTIRQAQYGDPFEEAQAKIQVFR